MVKHQIAIENYVKSKLDEIDGIKYVYQFEAGDLSGYPAVTIYGTKSESSPATTIDDAEIYTVTIHVYQEMTGNKTRAEAEDIINTTIQNIEAKFQSDYTLGGNVDILRSIVTEKGWNDREIPNRVAVISLVATKLNNIQ